MKRLIITYHMRNAEEDVETCAILPMEDAIADDVLALGDDSRYVQRGGAIWRALSAMAEIQGYFLTSIPHVKEDPRDFLPGPGFYESTSREVE